MTMVQIPAAQGPRFNTKIFTVSFSFYRSFSFSFY